MTVGPKDVQIGEDLISEQVSHGLQEIQNEIFEKANSKKDTAGKRGRPQSLKIPTKKAKGEKDESSHTLPEGTSLASHDATGTLPVPTCRVKSTAVKNRTTQYQELCHRYEMLRNRYHLLQKRRSQSEPPKRQKRGEDSEKEEEEDWFFIVARL